jgi:glutamate-1-semialdehyde 2,1-aminomutase
MGRPRGHVKVIELPEQGGFLGEFVRKTGGSRALYEKACRLTPHGVHSNWRIFDPYPLFMRKGKGSRIWDVDGNEYIDFNMAFGCLAAGHSHPVLVEAMRKQLEEGSIYGFESEMSVMLAEVLTSRFGYESVRFSTTGLEATLLAVRLARSFTGRRKILKFEGCFHGTHEMLMYNVKPDPYRAGHPATPTVVPASWGMPDELKNLAVIARYNDLEAARQVMRTHGNEVAGIILEPIAMNMGVVIPDIEFLKGLRELADEYSCLLIFDEVKTSGKFYRGAYEWCGVKADIMVAAKSIAGGFPLSAVLASREVFETVGPRKTAHGGTFNSNIWSATAAYITLTKILTEDALSRSQRLSEKLAKGYEDVLADSGIKYKISHIATSGTVYFGVDRVRNWRDFLKNDFGLWYSWFLGMLCGGILPQAAGYDEQWTVSVQHTDEDIEKAIEVMKDVVEKLKSGPYTPLKVEEVL